MAAWQKSYPIQKIKVLKSHLLVEVEGGGLVEQIKEQELAGMIARSNSSEELAKLLMAAHKFKVALGRLKQIIDQDLG